MVCGSTATVLLGLSMATCVVNAISDLDRVHPDELLRIIKPLHLKSFLTDRTETICKGRVIRDRQILKLRYFDGIGCL